jgi:hypothetical protein
VTDNLDAERFRLIFVSDAIPPSLRRIIEFLNGQMTNTEVLAIEVKQYVDASGTHQTIVPRIVGDTEAAKQTKSSRRGTRIDRDQLLAQLGDLDPDAEAAASALLDWTAAHERLELRWQQRSGRLPARYAGAAAHLLRRAARDALEEPARRRPHMGSRAL